ncbi:MAG: diadenylate cyclase [Verrucomicrobiota bacterium]|jgi:DNA integrity scanning protein DisA with diadenylate cyclase activity/mannitol/fructose-specific phosphotransferase system IIA component (Ntr-type)
MRLDKIIARSRIVDLRSLDLEGALRELLDVCVEKFTDLKSEPLLRGLLARESTMTTYLGFGVALPHVRVKMSRRYVLAIGRSRVGIRHDGALADERVHLIVMLIAGENARDYLQVLASIARQVKGKELVDNLVNASDLDMLHERLIGGVGGLQAVEAQQNRVNRLMFRQAERVAQGANCQAIMVFGDTFIGGIQPGVLRSKLKMILVTRASLETGDHDTEFNDTIQVRSFSNQRLAQLRSAMLVALTRGVVMFADRICCIGGITGSNQFDTLVVVDVEREFQTLLTGSTADLLPSDVKPEVLERVIAVATELAVEGREGRPVGCLFVIGDNEKVGSLSKPLVLNPFFGYKEEDRNILNPFMDETVKEFSSIDGAFVIRGDGVVESAGSLIQATDSNHSLPSGLGSRHAAAAAISVTTDCISIVVSSSTGQVTLFRRGVMLPLTEKRR